MSPATAPHFHIYARVAVAVCLLQPSLHSLRLLVPSLEAHSFFFCLTLFLLATRLCLSFFRLPSSLAEAS